MIRMGPWLMETSDEFTTLRQPKSVASLSSHAESILGRIRLVADPRQSMNAWPDPRRQQ